MYRAKLVKEALKRASMEEKQQYVQIQQQKAAIAQRIQEIGTSQEALNDREKLNILPEKHQPNPYAAVNRQTREATEKAARNQYQQDLEAYRAQNTSILTERLKLMGEFLALKKKLDEFEETEKWLLLSMAIRNQSSLMGFMQENKDHEEK